MATKSQEALQPSASIDAAHVEDSPSTSHRPAPLWVRHSRHVSESTSTSLSTPVDGRHSHARMRTSDDDWNPPLGSSPASTPIDHDVVSKFTSEAVAAKFKNAPTVHSPEGATFESPLASPDVSHLSAGSSLFRGSRSHGWFAPANLANASSAPLSRVTSSGPDKTADPSNKDSVSDPGKAESSHGVPADARDSSQMGLQLAASPDASPQKTAAAPLEATGPVESTGPVETTRQQETTRPQEVTEPKEATEYPQSADAPQFTSTRGPSPSAAPPIAPPAAARTVSLPPPQADPSSSHLPLDGADQTKEAAIFKEAAALDSQSKPAPVQNLGEQKAPSPTTYRQTRSRRSVGPYIIGKTLGQGSMGKVKLGINNATEEKVAIKIVPRFSLTANAHKLGDKATDSFLAKSAAKDASKEVRTKREASLVILLHHPYICGMKSVNVYPHHYYMVFDYIGGGQLLDYIIANGRLRERVARKFACQIGSALAYCHANSVVHRDLKIENILISKNGNIKLIDFGLSNLYAPTTQLNTFCGSLYFAAPELLNAQVYTGPEVDVWSFGVVLYVLVCGKVPFDDESMPNLHAKIKRGHVVYPPYLSAECAHLLSHMLVVDPSHRATLSQILSHAWMIKGKGAPPATHIPPRTPLTADDIDPSVVDGMQTFGFGNAQEISQNLLSIVTSSRYLSAVSSWHAKHDTASTELADASGAGPGTSHSDPKKNNRLSGIFPRRKLRPEASFDMIEPKESSPDPTQGFHPLLSIYHLVKEKQEREQLYGHGVLASSTLSLNAAPLPPPEPAASSHHPHAHQRRHSVVAGTALPSVVPPDAKPDVDEKAEGAPKLDVTAAHQSSVPALSSPKSPPNDSASSKRPGSKRRSWFGNRNSRLSPSKNGTAFIDQDAKYEESDRDSKSTRPLDSGGSSKSKESTGTSTRTQRHRGASVSSDMPLACQVKTVLLGSASVASTKSPRALRSQLISAYEKLGVSFDEVVSGFTCTHSSSVKGHEDRRVHFSVYLVKMRLLPGVYGLQFRRISGNEQQYQMLTKAILDASAL